MPDMKVIDTLKALKEKEKLSVKTWSNLSGVPEGTITNILTAKTEGTSFVTICTLAKTGGATADDIAYMAGIEKMEGVTISLEEATRLQRENDALRADLQQARERAQALEGMLTKTATLVEENKKQVEKTEQTLREALEHERKTSKAQRPALFIVGGTITAVLLFDLLNPHLGYIRYQLSKMSGRMIGWLRGMLG